MSGWALCLTSLACRRSAIRNACLHSQAKQLDVGITYARDLTLCMDPVVLNRGKDGHFWLARDARARCPHRRQADTGQLAKRRNGNDASRPRARHLSQDRHESPGAVKSRIQRTRPPLQSRLNSELQSRGGCPCSASFLRALHQPAQFAGWTVGLGGDFSSHHPLGG